MAYTSVDSPLARSWWPQRRQGLVRVSYTEFRGEDEVLEDLARRVSPRVLEAPARLDAVRRELDEYFEGRREHFDMAIDWSSPRGLHARGARGPRRGSGSARCPPTPGSRRRRAARVRSARPATRSGANPMPVIVPCHRVLRTGGTLGGYTGGIERKEFLLRLEGSCSSIGPPRERWPSG